MLMRKLLERFRGSAKPEHLMEDEFFGNLTWDEAHYGWRGEMTMANGKAAAFTIDGLKTDESIPEAVRDTGKFLKANASLIHDKIAISMSEFYNSTWGNGDIITPEEMAQRITLNHVSFYDEGDGMLYYEAADELFTDHTICASIDANGEVGEPGIEG